LAPEVVNAEIERDRQLVHFQALAVSESLALKPLQFLSHDQERALYVARGKAF
jgi:hypothetical protein